MPFDPHGIAIADFDYPLPDDRIARYPLPQRDHSKLLCLRGNDLSEHHFYDLPSLLPHDTLLVFNNTRVIHARLLFRKETGAAIEVFCLEPHGMPVAQVFEQTQHCTWECLVGNNKKWKSGPLVRHLDMEGRNVTLTAERRQADGNAWVVDFSWTGGLSFAEIIGHAGVIPLPPYLGREAEADDATRYQTIYALHDGSVAAPTAGLHFTPEVMQALVARGIKTDYVTLHVGAGTFKPVSTATIGEHDMHVEKVLINRATVESLLAGHRVVAVGTTSVRTLESLYWFGVKLLAGEADGGMSVCQWDPYRLEARSTGTREALQAVAAFMDSHSLPTLEGETRLMIAPSYRYHVVSGLVTNFHQPKSTLLLLVSALIGDRWRDCYRYALDHQFRFLSYGDSCLFLPQA